MKKEARGFVAGMMVAGLIAGSVITAGAVVGRMQANLDYNNIKISLNGQTITPKDANGNTVEPFAINGTTYLPVRAVGDALGLDVNWSAGTSTVLLSGVTGNGWMTSGDAIDFAGYILEANIYKGFCDTARDIQALAQDMAAGETLITSGVMSAENTMQIKQNAKNNASAISTNVEIASSLVEISYSNNATMNSIVADLQRASSALQTASNHMGSYDTTFTDNYSTALQYAGNAVQKADSAYSMQMDSMLEVCYAGSPEGAANNTVTDNDAPTSGNKPQTHDSNSSKLLNQDTSSSNNSRNDAQTLDRDNSGNSGVDLNAQYAADRAALDAAHQAEMERLEKERDEAQKNYEMAGYGMPDGGQKELVENVAEQNYNNAENAIKEAESEYQKQLDELNSKYGI